MTTPIAELPTTLAEAHALILALAEERAAIEAENSRIASEIARLTAANADLAAVHQTADARIVELTAIVWMLERTLCGTRSERFRSDTPSDEQIAFKYFDVIGCNSGKSYRIQHGVSANVLELNNAGRSTVGWCFVPAGDLVPGDVMLAQKIALETDERGAIAVARQFLVPPLPSHLSNGA